tara:strand:+ start:2483 stop:3847 length:1365 start_codon:yes stop_codon:yes gene_type:complete
MVNHNISAQIEKYTAFKLSYGHTELANNDDSHHKMLAICNSEYIREEQEKTDAVVHVAIMTDVSYSMQGRPMAAAREAIRNIPVQLLGGSIKNFSVSFNTFHGEVQDWEPPHCDIPTEELATKCNAYADALCIPANSVGTNHQAAVQSCFEYLQPKSGLKHVVLITDGDANRGITSPIRLKREIDERLNDLGFDHEIVFHCVVVGSSVNREVPKSICAPTAGIVAFAATASALPEEMAKVFGPMREAPHAIAFSLRWGNTGELRKVTRHGLLTPNHKHVLLDVSFSPTSATTSPDATEVTLTVGGFGMWISRPYTLKPKAELQEVVLPEDLKFELEAIELEEKMAAEAEQALQTSGYQGMAEVVEAVALSQPVMGMPVHIQERFTRRSLVTRSLADAEPSAPMEPDEFGGDAPVYRSLGSGAVGPNTYSASGQSGVNANVASLRMQSVMSQSEY